MWHECWRSWIRSWPRASDSFEGGRCEGCGRRSRDGGTPEESSRNGEGVSAVIEDGGRPSEDGCLDSRVIRLWLEQDVLRALMARFTDVTTTRLLQPSHFRVAETYAVAPALVRPFDEGM